MSTRLGFSSLVILSSALLLACGNELQIGGNGGGGGDATSTGSTTSGSTTTPTNNSCAAANASTIPGVHIDITSTDCTLSLSNPTLTIDYQVVIDADVPGIRPVPQDAGSCGQPEASGLITFESVRGGDQKYCLCDVGPCFPEDFPVKTLAKGTFPASFTWDGHNWYGPSDTVNPEGPLFEVGDYEFTVKAKGFQTTANGEVPFEVEVAMPVHVVP